MREEAAFYIDIRYLTLWDSSFSYRNKEIAYECVATTMDNVMNSFFGVDWTTYTYWILLLFVLLFNLFNRDCKGRKNRGDWKISKKVSNAGFAHLRWFVLLQKQRYPLRMSDIQKKEMQWVLWVCRNTYKRHSLLSFLLLLLCCLTRLMGWKRDNIRLNVATTVQSNSYLRSPSPACSPRAKMACYVLVGSSGGGCRTNHNKRTYKLHPFFLCRSFDILFPEKLVLTKPDDDL